MTSSNEMKISVEVNSFFFFNKSLFLNFITYYFVGTSKSVFMGLNVLVCKIGIIMSNFKAYR